ncbi:uncharacterized protein CFAP92 [Artibeus jamaicensis]|uniref:uncharacterized protein CFAP92 n=1 Tax=Artibeus jamaicensis TaxID=9417 RepID=UPI00235A7340|nr:uncharacterized protein CFAP92 [Artibeus jamaicensis]
MSLHAWDWEDEDTASMEPTSSMGSFCQSVSDCDVEEYLKARAQAPESDSDRQCSSIESSDGPGSAFHSDMPQVVPCTFVISLAFPVSVGHKGKYISLMEKHRKHPKMDKPVIKGHHFYHIEYCPLPDDKEPKKVDMVMFPTIVKVFLDSGVKTVKPWHEGDKVWVSWTQAFNMNVTKELLKKMIFYKITLRIWDTTDKVSKKVRYYRLKTDGHSEEVGSFGKSEDVRHLVLNQRKLSEQSVHVQVECNQEYIPKKIEKAEKPLKSLRGSHPAESEAFSSNTEENAKLLRMEDLFKWKESGRGKKDLRKRRKYQAEEDIDPKPADQWKRCRVFSIQLGLMPLLAGWQTIASHGSEKSASILDCLLTLKTEVPIMTEEQKQDLNPLIIKIKSASCLPSQPVPFHELERLCTPVYCKYQFHKTPVHQTEGQPHGSHISFQDINVIFLGAMHPNDLREYLEGPPMVVEVHDRDRKSEEYSRKPTLFGEDPLDSYINFQALISPKETESNPFESQNKMWDPYGVARVSFAELLLGHKYLNLAIPIHSCEPKPIHHNQDRRSKKVVGFKVPADAHHGPMPMGNYLEANSLLKLRVDISVPLRAVAEAASPDLTGTQFGRIIFIFDSRKSLLLRSLLRDITLINAKALDLDSFPIPTIQQILLAFRVRAKIQERQDLDVLTGFHLLDGKIHLLILEGIADQGLKRLWDSHQSRISNSQHGKHKVLYNSQLLFQHRLYADLDTVLYHVHLFKPVSQLVKQLELYLSNTLMQKAFQALTRIYCICHYSTNLREVVTRDLLPSSAMIEHLSQEFGLPVSQEKLIDRKPLAVSPHPTPNLEDFRSQTSTHTVDILSHQEKYLQWRNTMMLKNKGQKHNLIQKNIMGAYQVRKKPPKSVVKVIRSSGPIKDAVYNYSIQTLNSTEFAKKELYREMAKEPNRRFAYSQNYLSAMVEPQDSKEEEKKARKKSRQAWLTANGFQVTGLHRSTERDHLKLLPIGATTELTEEWRENALFANVLQPVLDRERWSWDRRHQDFDLYKKPPPFLKLPAAPSPGQKQVGGRKGAALCPEQYGPSRRSWQCPPQATTTTRHAAPPPGQLLHVPCAPPSLAPQLGAKAFDLPSHSHLRFLHDG